MNYQKLFDYMYDQHGVTLLEQDMQKIERIINDDQTEIIEEKPVLIGYLNKKFGYNHYHPINVGSPVYELNDRYFFEMVLIRSNETQRQSFYKHSLKPCIDFININ